MRVLRFAIPTGLAAGIASFVAYELAIREGVSLVEARSMATLVLSALGLFALGIVMRPLIAWKRWLIAGMAALLVVLMLAPPAQEFFELALPRPVVFMAAIGIVAVTGTAMVGTLRAVGWIRHVPEILMQAPEEASGAIRKLRAKVAEYTSTRRARSASAVGEPSPSPTVEPPIDVEPEGEPERGQVTDPLGEIEWFDPDDVLPSEGELELE